MNALSDTKLLITGKMGSGKGFAASFLAKRFGARCWSRTEMMKILAHAIIDQVGDPDDVLKAICPDPEQREEVRRDLLGYAGEYSPELGKPRRMYQDITAICQEHDPLCFEVELESRIRNVGANGMTIVDDVRSRPAFDYFVDAGYKSLRIDASENVRKKRILERDGYLPSEAAFNHASEVELDDVKHDYRVINDGEDLQRFYDELGLVLGLCSSEH